MDLCRLYWVDQSAKRQPHNSVIKAMVRSGNRALIRSGCRIAVWIFDYHLLYKKMLQLLDKDWNKQLGIQFYRLALGEYSLDVHRFRHV